MKYSKQIFLLLFGLVLQFSCSQDLGPIETEIKAVEQHLIRGLQLEGEDQVTYTLEERMKNYNVPGLSIAVVENGELRWAKGYGIANTNTGAKVDENTLFQAGSISKPVAALAVMKLLEQGKVDLDADVNTYLKDWKIPESKFTEDQKVTLRLLLTHSAGTTVHGFPGYTQKEDFPSVIDVLDGRGNTDAVVLDTIPNTLWRYSGGGYTIMEKVVEDVSNQTLEDFMAVTFFKPLKMSRSTYDQPINPEEYDNISAAYNGNGEIVEGLWNNYPEQAAAGLWTTPTDLATYCIAVQKGYKEGVDGVLKSSTIKTMLTKHKNDWGLGPSLEKEGDSLIFQHGGKNNGFTNNMRAYAGLGRAVIVMTSADGGNGLIREIMLGISDYYKWDMMKPRTIKTIPLNKNVIPSIVGDYVLNYQVPGVGDYNSEVKFEDDKLIVVDKVEQTTFILTAIEPLVFIDIDTGYKFVFDPEKKELFVNNRFTFNRKE